MCNITLTNLSFLKAGRQTRQDVVDRIGGSDGLMQDIRTASPYRVPDDRHTCSVSGTYYYTHVIGTYMYKYPAHPKCYTHVITLVIIKF